MKCPKCDSKLKTINVKVAGAQNKVKSYQCSKCDYFEFEADSSKRIIEELNQVPLKIKQKIIKLSKDRLGIYFNKNIIRCLELKNGEDIYLSVPDRKHIILELR